MDMETLNDKHLAWYNDFAKDIIIYGKIENHYKPGYIDIPEKLGCKIKITRVIFPTDNRPEQ